MSEEPSLAKIVNNFEVLENSHQVDDFNQLKQNRMLCFCILSEKKLKIVLMKTAFDKETKYQTFSFLHLSSHYIKAHQVPVTYHSNKNIFPYHLLFRTNFIIKAKNMIQELLNSVVDEKKLPSNTTSQTQQNLRCPRCDSPNTKFCYYNNYNLTQPRHFCKTCRRYWTKGGALRNVPIGGGCRKAKPFSSTLNTPTSLNSNNNNPGCGTIVDGMGRFGHLAEGMDPSMWGSAPHGSHLLTLLRATTSQLNHNLTNPVTQLQYQPQQQLQYNLLNDGPTSYGLHELYQRLRSSNNDYLPMVTATAMPNTASVMEPVPLSAVDFGYWNSTMPWSDLSTTANGAYN